MSLNSRSCRLAMNYTYGPEYTIDLQEGAIEQHREQHAKNHSGHKTQNTVEKKLRNLVLFFAIRFGVTSGAEITNCIFKYVTHHWMEPIEDKLYNSKVVNLWVMDESSMCVWSVVLSRNIMCLAPKNLQLSYWGSEAIKHTRLIWVTHRSRELLCNNYTFQYLATNSSTNGLRSPFLVWTR